MSEYININDLKKSFKSFVLGPVDLDIPKGAVTAILGSNASGKTTLLKCLAGLYVCDRGHGWYPGKKEQSRIGFVFDECPYPGSFTVQGLSKVLSDLYPDWDQMNYSEMCS